MEKENIEKLLQTAFAEIEKSLNANTVLGEPVKVEGITFIPVVTMGFGIGAGGGGGKYPEYSKGQGEGVGAGGGGGVKPVALIIIENNKVRIEPIKGGMLESVAESIVSALKKDKKKKED